MCTDPVHCPLIPAFTASVLVHQRQGVHYPYAQEYEEQLYGRLLHAHLLVELRYQVRAGYVDEAPSGQREQEGREALDGPQRKDDDGSKHRG